MTRIYKIETTEIWQAAKATGIYQGSPADTADGFIHFSTATQLAGTLEKHFAGRSDLRLIAFDAKSLGPDLLWEPARNGDLFPHLYAPLQTGLVLWEKPIEQTAGGAHTLPSLEQPAPGEED